jgi:adenine-specific DNA-methyltransferase
MAERRSKSEKMLNTVPVEDYEHASTRANNPLAGQAHLDRDQTPVTQLTYDPHLDPQLVWAGKAEHGVVDVPAPSIHVHEEISVQKIIGSVRKKRFAPSLFDITELDAAQAVEFYQHEKSWTNRMILGDSLVVMNSLIERERMAGQVQCVFMDPPYGIKYQSNFQPGISSRAVSDGKDEDLTREPEMIQAYRDTWQLGIHSYLTYLRDRLTVARELCAEAGSVFVQIGEDNVHRVRLIMDEVFGSENFVSQIPFIKTSGKGGNLLDNVNDYLIWYAKDKSKMKYFQLYSERSEKAIASGYTWLETPDGGRRRLTKGEVGGQVPVEGRRFMTSSLVSTSGGASSSFPVDFEGVTYTPSKNTYWKTNPQGMEALKSARRLIGIGNTLNYIRYEDDLSHVALTNWWNDTIESTFTVDKRYVVQTYAKVIARCLLMTTEPGDLVLDPTTGSGTTAFAAEQYGRRWITLDTSRVAIAIARERLLTSVFPFYQLRDSKRGVDSGFVYKELERVTLRSITREEAEEPVVLVDQPLPLKGRVRVSGPFTVEALSRYTTNPSEVSPAEVRADMDASNHVEVLLGALQRQGIPRPGAKPMKIETISRISTAGALQAEGLLDLDGKAAKFAVSIGPRFGPITMSQVSEALQQSIGYELVVFAGFAVDSEAQAKLASGKIGGTPVALLLANPDLLVGNLLKNTSASQTFRLYASPDVLIGRSGDEFTVTVEGVDSYDASSGEVTSFGKSGIQAWFLDDNYDGLVFKISQAFFPVSDGWEKLERALRGTVDADLVAQLHSWSSLPFEAGDQQRIAVRVIANDGNAAEVVMDLPAMRPTKGRKK